MANSVSVSSDRNTNATSMDKQQPYSSKLNEFEEELEKIVIGCEQSCAICYKLIIRLSKHIRETHTPVLDHNINPGHHAEVLIEMPQDPRSPKQNDKDPLALCENSENCSSSSSDRRLRKRKAINYAELNDGSGLTASSGDTEPITSLDPHGNIGNHATLFTLIRESEPAITNSTPELINFNTIFIANDSVSSDQSNEMPVNKLKCDICNKIFSNAFYLHNHVTTHTRLVSTQWGRVSLESHVEDAFALSLDKTETRTHRHHHQPRILRKKKTNFSEKINPLHFTEPLGQKSTSIVQEFESDYVADTDDTKFELMPLGIEMSKQDPLCASASQSSNRDGRPDLFETDSPEFKYDADSCNGDSNPENSVPVSNNEESEIDFNSEFESGGEKECNNTIKYVKVKASRHKCKNCNEDFKTKCALKIHTRTHGTQKQWECKLCVKQLSSSEELADHIMESHKEVIEKPYSCTFCNKGFSDATELNEHFRQFHPTSLPYVCENCEKRFFDERDLKSHSESHNEEKSFTCEYCQKVYRDTQRLLFHVKTHHTKEKPYKCDLCEKSFNIKENLDKHEKLLHRPSKPVTRETRVSVAYSKKNNKIACAICKQTFANPCNLSTHLRVRHENILGHRYACHICNERYISKHLLTAHIYKSHPGRRRLECKICFKQFISPWKLSGHFRTHTGEKPFSCTICSKAFHIQDLLRRHQLVHTGERPFKCDVCGSTIST